ncbi:unnamed protein product [Triticum aestivum]|uniref:WPP domain-containing protein n=3 Tax=Triticinae TaxID=1648030 RepID=A0A9R1EVC7_WHEAT|nr:hypothetical protein CFC21_030424 [Triticum aestivum]SPT18723.1 unnamed protein product [Triticum aestivum]
MDELDFTTRGRDFGQQPARLLLDSSLIGIRGGNLTELQCTQGKIASSLNRAAWEQNPSGFLPKSPFDHYAVARKLALPCLPSQGKYLVHTSPRKACRPRRWRRVGRELRVNPLDLDVNFLVLATGYSLGIVSKNLDQRTLSPSFIASKCLVGSMIDGHRNGKRIRVKDFGLGGVGCKTRRWAIRTRGEASFGESYLMASDAGDAFSNNRHQTMSLSYDGSQSEDRQSEEVQSAYKKFSAGDEDVIRGFVNLDETEEQNEENEWSWVPQEEDPLAESASSLEKAQEVLEKFFKKNEDLETEMLKLSELGKEFVAEDSHDGNIGLPYIGADVLGMNQKMECLELKLKEASDTITEKDSRLSELQSLINSAHTPTLQTEPVNVDELETELESHLQDKIEAEIQCLVMVKARQNWQARAEDQIALEEHKLSAGEDTRMLLKLQDTEKKIVMLKEQVDRLEAHEKELSVTTEVLRMQSKTFKIGLFGLLQLIMLCLSLKMFFAQDSARFGDLVPT